MIVVELSDRLQGLSHESGLALHEVKIQIGENIENVNRIEVVEIDGERVIVLRQ